MYPFERFTEKAKEVLTLAQEEATTSQHSYIGTEHLLIALLRQRTGLAAVALAELGIELEAVRATINQVLGRNERITVKQIIPTSRVKKVIEIAFEQAREMGQAFVGTEHILLGILLEGEGVAAHVLIDLGAPVEKVWPKVTELLAKNPPPKEATVPRLDDEVQSLLNRARALASAEGKDLVGLDELRRALDAG